MIVEEFASLDGGIAGLTSDTNSMFRKEICKWLILTASRSHHCKHVLKRAVDVSDKNISKGSVTGMNVIIFGGP